MDSKAIGSMDMGFLMGIQIVVPTAAAHMVQFEIE